VNLTYEIKFKSKRISGECGNEPKQTETETETGLELINQTITNIVSSKSQCVAPDMLRLGMIATDKTFNRSHPPTPETDWQ